MSKNIDLTGIAGIEQLPQETFALIVKFGNPEYYTNEKVSSEVFENYLKNLVSTAKKKDKQQVEEYLQAYLFGKEFSNEFHYLFEQLTDEDDESISHGIIPATIYQYLVKKLSTASPEKVATTLVEFVKEFCVIYDDVVEVVIENFDTPTQDEQQEQESSAQESTEQTAGDNIVTDTPKEDVKNPQEHTQQQAYELLMLKNELTKIKGKLDKVELNNPQQQININQLNVTQQQQEKPKLTAAERIEKARQFAKLTETYAKIEAKYQAFNEFLAGYNGEETGSILFKNGSEKIEIMNGKTMLKVLAMVYHDLTQIVEEYRIKVETFVM